MAKKKKKQKKIHVGNIMTKAKVHKAEDLKLYDRNRKKKQQRQEQDET